MAVAVGTRDRGVWERDTPPSPRGRLRRPGTPPGSLRGNGPFLVALVMLLSREMWPCPQGQRGPVPSAGGAAASDCGETPGRGLLAHLLLGSPH